MTQTEARTQPITFDSAPATLQHIRRVQDLMRLARYNLTRRARVHDASKLQEPEKSMFDQATGVLRDLTYGSPAYYRQLEKLKPALDHHYAHNPHHPEAHQEGIAGMSLLDLTEMVCDWVAASERHRTGDPYESLRKNVDRFGITPQLAAILRATLDEILAEDGA